MKRMLSVLLCVAAPALAKEVKGRVTHTEDGSPALKKQLGAEVLKVNVLTSDGNVVVLNAVEGTTNVLDAGRVASLQTLRSGAMISATLADDDCKLDSDRCVASEIDVQKPGSTVRTVEAVRQRSDAAFTEMDSGKAPDVAQPFGEHRVSGREAAEDLDEQRDASCPDGMVPWIKDGARVIDQDGHGACRAKRQFVKGELTNLGSDKLVVADSRFGLRMGYAHLDNASYLALTPEVDMHFGDRVALGLGLPLHVLAYAGGFVDHNGFHLRQHDYDNPADFARILRFFTVGKKEDQFFLNVSQLFAASIGHGAIVRRYSGNTDLNITRVGAQLDAYGKWGGFEAFVGDVVQPTHFFAALAFLKPFGFLGGDRLAQTSIGVSTAADLKAPYRLARLGPTIQVGGDDICGTGNEPTGAVACQSGEPILMETRRAQLVGLDVETKLVKTENVDLKPYADYSKLLDIDTATGGLGAQTKGGGGATLGLLGRFNAGDVKVHAFRVVVEGRYFDGNYLPGYFDTFYEVQKYQFITGAANTGYEPKLWTILARNPAHKRGGYYVEAAYQYNGGFAVMAAFEDSFHVAGPDSICNSAAACSGDSLMKYVGGRNLTLHLEYPAYSWLQFFGSFYRRSFDGAPVDTARPLGDNTLVYGAFRLHILPILFLNGRVFRSWQPDPALGEMKNVWGGDLDLELGYEFDRAKRDVRK